MDDIQNLIDTYSLNIDEGVTSMRKSLMNAAICTAAEYIQRWREKSPGSMCPLEIEYIYCEEFENAEDPKKWLEDNRPENDNELIMYVLDNHDTMEPCRYKVYIASLLNMIDACSHTRWDFSFGPSEPDDDSDPQ